jgi:hypothetical protein
MQKVQFKTKIFRINHKKKEKLFSIKIIYNNRKYKIINLLFSDLSINLKIIIVEEDHNKTIKFKIIKIFKMIIRLSLMKTRISKCSQNNHSIMHLKINLMNNK